MATDDLDVRELFVEFLREPTRENYLAVFDVVTDGPAYDPYGGEVDGVQELVDQGRFAEALERGTS